MRTSALGTLALSALLPALHAACGAAPPPPVPPAPSSSAAPEPSLADRDVDPVASPPPASADPPAVAPPAPPAPPPPVPDVDIGSSPGDPRLSAGAARLVASEHRPARPLLEAALPAVDANGTLDARMAGHALLARACVALKDARCAQAQIEIVRALWKDPAVAMATLATGSADERETATRARRALNALGEALFLAADAKRAAALAERMPTYRGNGSKEDVMKHINKKVAPWITARRTKTEEAEKAYVEILGIQPEPPPRWVVAGAARVGELWGTFTVEFRAAPLPAAWKGSGPVPGSPELTWEELRNTYYAAIDEASEPMKSAARAAYTKCSSIAQKVKLEDAFSRSCDAWLAKNGPVAP